MIAAWSLYTIALTLLILLGAWAVEHLGSRWRVPRRFSWGLALWVALVVPPVLAIHRSARSSSPASANVAIARAILPPPIAPRMPHSISSPGLRRAALALSPEVAFDVERYFVRLWLLSSAGLFGFLLFSACRLWRERRCWREATVDGTRLLIAPDRGPAVVGVFRPRIVRPEWALALDADARELVMRHEREHLSARDSHLALFARIAPFVVPWNLPLWFITLRLELAIELDCDERVLRAVGDARQYGLLLIAVGARQSRGLDFGAALAARRSFLARRIATMIADRPRRTIRATLLFVLGIACISVAATRLPKPEPIVLGSGLPRVTARTGASTAVGDNRSSILNRERATGQPTGVISPHAAIRPRKSNGATPPRITADWENAPIEGVVAAIAKHAGIKITLSAGVSVWITAHIVDQPWDEALAQIAAAHGLRVLHNADGSVLITESSTSRQSSFGDFNAVFGGQLATTRQIRRVVGHVVDDSTGLPIAGAEIKVIGLQTIGEANRACTIRDGTFTLNVRDDSVHLEASAPGYQFAHAVVPPRDSTVVFRGRGTGEHLQIESVEVVKGATATSLYGPGAANGAVVVTTTRPRLSVGTPIWFFKGLPLAAPPRRPLLIIDGVPISADLIANTGVCLAQ